MRRALVRRWIAWVALVAIAGGVLPVRGSCCCTAKPVESLASAAAEAPHGCCAARHASYPAIAAVCPHCAAASETGWPDGCPCRVSRSAGGVPAVVVANRSGPRTVSIDEGATPVATGSWVVDSELSWSRGLRDRSAGLETRTSPTPLRVWFCVWRI